MPGIHYHLWNQYTLDDSSEITRDLEDIRNLGFDFLIVDLFESFICENGERYRKYQEGLNKLLEECPDFNLRILPVCNFGAGLFRRDWWNQNPHSGMRKKDGSLFINPLHQIPIANYDENCIRKFVAHQRYVVNLIWDSLYRHNGRRMVVALGDAGYHYTEKDLTFPGDCIAERKRRLSMCLNAMKQEASSSGYKVLVQSFRSVQPFHADLERMGIDYDEIIRNCDGFMDGVVHHPDAPGSTWHDQIRLGFDLVSRCKFLFPIVLCERVLFDPKGQFEAIIGNTSPSDLVFYPYNAMNNEVCLRDYEPHRVVVRDLVSELEARKRNRSIHKRIGPASKLDRPESKKPNIEFKLISEFPLPCLGPNTPEGLHTVVGDPEGHLYFSDEFNHCVGSIDSRGQLQWWIGGQGLEEGRFWYPRGISLGWVEHNGRNQRCLAVCDSWNRRMQFLSLNGEPILSWNSHGRFGELVDVRYLVHSGDAANNSGDWLILDRDNHKLRLFNRSGRQLCEIGRPFPPSLETRWHSPSIFPADINGFVHTLMKQGGYDPLFYPLRILGNDHKNLFVWEPLSGRLKQPLFGSLIPISLALPQGFQWIAADGNGFVSWNEGAGILCFHKNDGEILLEICIDGVPLASDLPSDEIWLQSSGKLRHCKWQSPVKSGTSEGEFLPLRISLEEQSQDLKVEFPSILFPELAGLFSELITLNDNLLSVHSGNRSDTRFVNRLSSRIDEVNGNLKDMCRRINEQINPSFRWCAAIGTQALIDHVLPPQVDRIDRIWKKLAYHVSPLLADLQKSLDDLVAYRTGSSEPGAISAHIPNEWENLIAKQESLLENLIAEILPWAGFTSPDLLPWQEAGADDSKPIHGEISVEDVIRLPKIPFEIA